MPFKISLQPFLHRLPAIPPHAFPHRTDERVGGQVALGELLFERAVLSRIEEAHGAPPLCRSLYLYPYCSSALVSSPPPRLSCRYPCQRPCCNRRPSQRFDRLRGWKKC